MNAKQWFLAVTLGTTGLLGAAALDATSVRAQSNTTGAISGVVTDSKTGEALAGVTVTVSSSSLQGQQTAITESDGAYRVSSLPPGDYIVTFFYGDITVSRNGVNVGIEKTTSVFQKLNSTEVGGEQIKIVGHASTIDTSTTAQGITLDKEYMNNIPVPGRTFDAILGAAAGSQGDALGVAFSGSSSLENQYYVDGVNTTGLQFGTVGSPVINDFIQEIEVITGGYNAEYGRATGGIANVVTKSGSNEFRGGVFGYYTPGQLVAPVNRIAEQNSPIDAVTNLAYNADFGFDLGGPIIKDKVWFYVGFGPALSASTTDRFIKSHTDCRVQLDSGALSACNRATMQNGGFADGVPDKDPATGFFITDDLAHSQVESKQTSYSILGKINFAVTPEHQGQISYIGQPSSGNIQGVYGLPDSTAASYSGLTNDFTGKWTSKFNDNKTEIEAVIGWHTATYDQTATDPALNSQPSNVLLFGNLGNWSGFTDSHGGGESQATKQGCADNTPNDPYPLITNCPDNGVGYSIGGPGGLVHNKEDRKSAQISITQRVKALGNHEIKAGADIQDDSLTEMRLLSGGYAIQNLVGNSEIDIQRWVQLAPPNTDVTTAAGMRFDNTCRDSTTKKTYQCDFLQGTIGYPGTQVDSSTLNWSAYVRDSWQVLPNFTINAGLRYEQQHLRYTKELQNTQDPLTLEHLGQDALDLSGMWAPRIGATYDWTKEGKSKLYGHWGRFYESVPQDINSRSFGGEVFYNQRFSTAATGNQCGSTDPKIGGPGGQGCVADLNQVASIQEVLTGASGELVAPGVKAQYLDEVILGVEYELIDDLKLGITYQNRRLGRVIEDVSTDGAQTYIITNPGDFSEDQLTAFKQRIDQTTDMAEKARLQHELTEFEGLKVFNGDPPKRDYNALQFTLTRRFSKALYLQASYTYSRTTGNYPGLISYDNGQVDPNISSQYDLIELLANRQGALPQDRPHYIKIDSYYTFDLKKAGQLTVGIRFRALSGTPVNVLGPHYLYGPNESFILPRGSLERTDFDTGLDVHVGYARNVGHGMKLELFTDLFNVYDSQGTASVDQTYAPAYSGNNINPISGGTYSDLIFAKAIDVNGNETSTPIKRNVDFGHQNGLYSPFSVRLGLRLSF